MTEPEYREALARAEALMGAKAGTPEAEELKALAERIEAYEGEYPLGTPDTRAEIVDRWVGATAFSDDATLEHEMDQGSFNVIDLRILIMEITELRERVGRLERVIEPFAVEGQQQVRFWGPKHPTVALWKEAYRLMHGDLYAAMRAVNFPGAEDLP